MRTPDNEAQRMPARGAPGGLRLLLITWALIVPVFMSGAAGRGARLETISARTDAQGTSILLESSEPVAYAASQPDPLTIVVELREASASGVVNRVAGGRHDAVSAVTVEDAVANDGVTVARVRVQLAAPAPHRVRSSRNVISVEIEGGATQATGLADLSARTSRIGGRAANLAPARPVAATTLRAVRVSGDQDHPVVTLCGDGPLPAATVNLVSEPTIRLVLDFPGVATAAPPATAVGRGGVERVRVAPNSVTPLVTRVVFDLARRAPYRLEPNGADLDVVFGEAAASGTASAPSVAPPATLLDPVAALTLPIPNDAVRAKSGEAAAPPQKPATSEPPAAPAGKPATATPPAQAPGPGEAPAPSPAIPAPAPPGSALANAAGQPGDTAARTETAEAPRPAARQQVAPLIDTTSRTVAAGQKQYTGFPVSLDFGPNADLRIVLRTFAELSGLNIVIDPATKGSVDVALRDVPWDQALDIILSANQLGYIVNGTIVRIAPLTVLAEEETQRRRLSDEQVLGGQLGVMTRTLSYAQADKLVLMLKQTALTRRGQVQVDARTNTLIISDIASALETVGTLLETLDKPQPQVEIEARVVQTTRDYARDLGAQLGIGGHVAPALGNTTPLAFPNQGSITGRSGVTQGEGVPSAVNMPVVKAGASAVGISLGSVNGAFNLDLALSALEKTGRGRLLSTPRVLAQNNVTASIMQGVQIPIQTLANNTVMVSFRDAALKLEVTPQITANGTVILQLVVENGKPDYTKSINNIPPINTQQAKTTLLVNDGETIVIGGIYVSDEQSQLERTPGLYKIPLLGRLFRRDSIANQSTELMIFMTTKIVK
jgi:type IV pilus assembly protein PilQ